MTVVTVAQIQTEGVTDVLLPAGRDLRLDRPCKLKRFRALAADWLTEASADERQDEPGVSTVSREKAGHAAKVQETRSTIYVLYS